MAKSQHEPAYRPVPPFLRQLREDAGLTQRALGQRLRKPQSWVYNCEVANRRVDVAEFALWCRACSVEPTEALRELLLDHPVMKSRMRELRERREKAR